MPRFFSSALKEIDTAIVNRVNNIRPESRIFNYGTHVLSFAATTAICFFAINPPSQNTPIPPRAPRKKS